MSVNATYPPRERLEWAHKHLLDLMAVYNAFEQQDPYRIAVERDPKTGDYLQRLRITPPLPNDIPFRIGDFVHSLRATLDNMIWLLRIPNMIDPRILKLAAFKVADVLDPDGPEHDWKSFRGRVQHCLPDDVLDKLHEFQPHISGHDELAILGELWNGDKHRAPHIAVSAIRHHRVTFTTTYPQSLIAPPPPELLMSSSGPFEDGDVVQRIRDHPGMDPNLDADITCQPCFDPLGPGRGEPLWPLLVRMESYVRDEVIPAFERL
jgi:hypothetical protein